MDLGDASESHTEYSDPSEEEDEDYYHGACEDDY